MINWLMAVSDSIPLRGRNTERKDQWTCMLTGGLTVGSQTFHCTHPTMGFTADIVCGLSLEVRLDVNSHLVALSLGGDEQIRIHTCSLKEIFDSHNWEGNSFCRVYWLARPSVASIFTHRRGEWVLSLGWRIGCMHMRGRSLNGIECRCSWLRGWIVCIIQVSNALSSTSSYLPEGQVSCMLTHRLYAYEGKKPWWHWM